MKVSLANKNTDCKAYGLTFDEKGFCDAELKVIQSLLDSGALVEVKKNKKADK